MNVGISLDENISKIFLINVPKETRRYVSFSGFRGHHWKGIIAFDVADVKLQQ